MKTVLKLMLLRFPYRHSFSDIEFRFTALQCQARAPVRVCLWDSFRTHPTKTRILRVGWNRCYYGFVYGKQLCVFDAALLCPAFTIRSRYYWMYVCFDCNKMQHTILLNLHNYVFVLLIPTVEYCTSSVTKNILWTVLARVYVCARAREYVCLCCRAYC